MIFIFWKLLLMQRGTCVRRTLRRRQTPFAADRVLPVFRRRLAIFWQLRAILRGIFVKLLFLLSLSQNFSPVFSLIFRL